MSCTPSFFFFNYVGMLLQPIVPSLPGGPQTDKEGKKNKQKQTIQKQSKDCNYVLYNKHSSTIKVTTLCKHVLPF